VHRGMLDTIQVLCRFLYSRHTSGYPLCDGHTMEGYNFRWRGAVLDDAAAASARTDYLTAATRYYGRQSEYDVMEVTCTEERGYDGDWLPVVPGKAAGIRACSGCGVTKSMLGEPGGTRKMKSCSRCRWVFYCSGACQKEHYKKHKKECTYLRASSSRCPAPS
jgi:hypothetical protein